MDSIAYERHDRLFGIPADKILVILRDTPLANWGQGGVIANDPDFLEKSLSVH